LGGRDVIIAFVGSSGSGKSTLIKKITKHPIFRNQKIYIHEEDSFLFLNLAKKIFGNELFRKYNRDKMSIKTKNGNRIFSFFVYCLYPPIIYLEYFFLYVLYKVIFKKRVLLCDRYIYDYIITFKTNLKIDNRINSWLYLNFPRPDLTFFLDINSDTHSMRNKSNAERTLVFTKHFHKKVISNYKKIAKIKKLLTIDTSSSATRAIKDVVKHMENRKKLLVSKEVAICGLDGVGKTTICNLLNSYCISLNVPSKVLHFYHSNIILKILRKLRIFNEKPISKKKLIQIRNKNASRKERHQIINSILALIHFTDSYIQYLFFRAVYSKSIIIYDRYFYDYLISFQYFKVKWWNNFEKFIPRANNEFLIVNSPEVAYERKPEANWDFYDFEHSAYIKMAKKKNFTIINGKNKKPEVILNDILKNLKN